MIDTRSGSGRRPGGLMIPAIALAIFLSGWAGLAVASEDGAPTLERRFELDSLADIDARAAAMPSSMVAPGLDLQLGGWLRTMYFTFNNDLGDTHHGATADLRLWAQLRLDETHTLYVRPRVDYTYLGTGNNFSEDDDQFSGLRLDLGFYHLDVARFLAGIFEDPPLETLGFAAGRKFFVIGSGLLLARRADGIELRGRQGDVEYLLFGAKTVHSDDDEDQSRPNNGDSDRHFVAAQVAYVYSPMLKPYVLFMRQRDHNGRHPAPWAQSYIYDSNYAGLGVEAALGSRAHLVVEWVKEDGHSSSRLPGTAREEIDASALVARVNVPLGDQRKTRLYAQYLFGSGDSDRMEPIDAISGNKPGSTDHSFVPFGFVDTGWALAPTLSNLHVFQVGGATKPADNLEVGTSLYVFCKEHTAAGISDPGATRDSHDVGQEIDVYANWSVFSDLAVSAVVGYFRPGSAMDPKVGRPYGQLSVTYSF